jgi:hypothetical protein
MGRRRRRKVEPTDEWHELLPLFEWPEQRVYEELRPLVLFGGSVAERAGQTGTPERTMYRRIERFERDGMESLFASDLAAARDKRRGLEPRTRVACFPSRLRRVAPRRDLPLSYGRGR